MLAGTGRVLEALPRFRFGDAELDWLATSGWSDDATLEYLADYRFTGDGGVRGGRGVLPGVAA